MKIVITGGLGYIGTELCALYSKESRKKEIVVFDNKFVSANIVALKKEKIKFVQGDLLNKEQVAGVVGDADLVYHLAGITDVPRTTSQADQDKEQLINKVAVDGSRNIIDSMKKGAKIVFPSSHVIFEGLKEQVLDIKEDYPPCPFLTYSKGKFAIEQYLTGSDRNYVILRLGSNCGLSGCTMRMDIMPNAFARIASQDGTIKLFGGGIQYKPLVDVRDVARCMKYLGEKKDVSREIFNVVCDNLTVRDVAEICKKVNPKVNLVPTDDEIPNKGYTLSNKKLLSTGFKFKHAIKDSLKEMINAWKST